MGCNCGGPSNRGPQPAVRDRRPSEPDPATRQRREAKKPGEAGYVYRGPNGGSGTEKKA